MKKLAKMIKLRAF